MWSMLMIHFCLVHLIVICRNFFQRWQMLYRMELHWDKFQLLQVQCRASISTPAHERIVPKLGIDYLGAFLTHDGLPGHELGRRIGMAKRDFLELQKVWQHSSLPRFRKIEIYKALMESKLMYSLSCLWLLLPIVDGWTAFRTSVYEVFLASHLRLFQECRTWKFYAGHLTLLPLTCFSNHNSYFLAKL